jgi:hypothetical protein
VKTSKSKAPSKTVSASSKVSKKAEITDLLDFSTEKDMRSLDSFLGSDEDAGKAVKGKGGVRRDVVDSKVRKDADGKGERERGGSKSSAPKPNSKERGEDGAANPSLDKASCDERIRRRAEEKDRQRAAEALAKLEAICGGGAAAQEEVRWGGVNPPGRGGGADDSDSDSDDAAARRARRAQRRREKEARREARAGGGGADGGAGPGTGSGAGNPAPQSESTMQRLRREAEEAKERKKREQQEHMAKFSGQVDLPRAQHFLPAFFCCL